MTYTFKPTLQEENGRWSAWIEALPGCATWGEDALQCLKEAAELVVEDMIECGEDIPVEPDAALQVIVV